MANLEREPTTVSGDAKAWLGEAVGLWADGRMPGLAGNLQNSPIAWDTETEPFQEIVAPLIERPRNTHRAEESLADVFRSGDSARRPGTANRLAGKHP